MYLCLEQPQPADHGLLGLAHLLLLPPRHRLLGATQLQPQLHHGKRRLLLPERSTAVASATVGRRQGVASASLRHPRRKDSSVGPQGPSLSQRAGVREQARPRGGRGDVCGQWA